MLNGWIRTGLLTRPWRLVPAAVACLILLSAVLGRPAVAESDAALLHGQGLLWRIDTPGSEPSYLFGTIHLTDERVTKLPPPVVKALESSTSMTGELILGAETRRTLAREIRLTGDRDLEDILGSDLYARVLEKTQPIGMFDASLRTLKPWVVMGLIGMPPEEVARAATGHLNVDEMLQKMAGDRGIPLHALESVAEQADAIGGMPEDDLVQIIREAVDMQAELHAIMEEMIGFYLAQDLAGLHAHMSELSAGTDADRLERFMDRVLDRRNFLMVDRMAGVLTEGNAFVAVGAMHLPGENGLLNLLEQRGHGITRVY